MLEAYRQRIVLLDDTSAQLDELGPAGVTALTSRRPVFAVGSATVPLIASGQVVAVWALELDDERAANDEERAFLVVLAGLAAHALERARLFDSERTIAETLQRSLLPERLPDVPGIDVAAHYTAGAKGVNVGGDWYDVIPLADGCVGVAIGDVIGHGVAPRR